MVLFGKLSCDFNAVKQGQISASEGEVVQILEIKNGYAVIRKKNEAEGQIPSYFIEVANDVVDGWTNQGVNEEFKEFSPNNADLPAPYQASFHLDQIVPIRESPQIPEIVAFHSIVPSEGPLFPSDIPYFIQELRDISVRYGEPVELQAQIGSKHEFGLKWTFPDRERTDVVIAAPSDRGIITLLLPNSTLKDIGRYHVTVANDYGKASSSCTVHIISAPSIPKNFQYAVDPAKKRAIRLRWFPPENSGGSKLLWYTVEYTRPGLTDYHEVIQGVKQTCIRISHLQSTIYTFRVYACNEFFRGDPSDTVTVDTEDIEVALSNAQFLDVQKKLKVNLLKTSFQECFNIDHKVGKGRTSVVRQLTCKISSNHFVGKFFLLDDLDFEKLSREIRILSGIQNSNIVQYFGTALSDDQVVLIMDKICGQQILTYIIDCGYLSEAIMQKFAGDLLNALTYIHSRGIAHLGIKPEELIIESSSKLPNLVLIDFGSSEEFTGEDPMNTSHLSIWQGGNVEYLAPEQLAHKPCCKSDVWSLGVLLFVLVTGISPFEDPEGSDEITRQRILNGEIVDCREKFKKYSPDLLKLIADIFAVEPRERLSSFACLNQSWMVSIQSEELFMVDHIEDYVDNRKDRMRSSFLLHEI